MDSVQGQAAPTSHEARRAGGPLSAPLLLLDANMVVIATSPSASDVLGVEVDQVLGAPCYVSVAGDPGREAHPPFSVSTRATVRVGSRPERFIALITPLQCAEGHLACAISVLAPHIEQTLPQASGTDHPVDARFFDLADAASDLVYELDLEGRFRYANPAFEKVTGYTREQVAQMHVLDIVAPEYRDLVAERLQERAAGFGRFLPVDIELIHAKGSRVLVEVVNSNLYDDHGRPVSIQGIARDITERRAVEARLRQHQKMEAIGSLAGGIAHDFNNLLCAILGNLQLARAALPEGDAAARVKAAERAAERATGITNQLLSYARRTPAGIRPIDPCELVDEVVEVFQRTIDPRIALDVIHASESVVVHADPGQVNRVIMNLCVNSRDALDECLAMRPVTAQGAAPRIIVTTEVVTVDHEEARMLPDARPGRYVRIAVSDNGVGMSAETRERAIEPFFTTKGDRNGTGLGLASVYSIVRAHGGFLLLDSAPVRGCVVQAHFPCDPLIIRATAPEARRGIVGGTETLLVADDDDMIREVTREALEGLGYEVLLAEDGLEAVEMFERAGDSIDLVVLDLMMPQLSGAEAMERIVAIEPSARVLLVSGYAELDTRGRQAQASAVGFLRKPFPIDELARTVRAVLDGDAETLPRRP